MPTRGTKGDKAHSRARAALRKEFPEEHRQYYVLEVYSNNFIRNPKQRAASLQRAYSKATTKLINAHKERYKEIVQMLLDRN